MSHTCKVCLVSLLALALVACNNVVSPSSDAAIDASFDAPIPNRQATESWKAEIAAITRAALSPPQQMPQGGDDHGPPVDNG